MKKLFLLFVLFGFQAQAQFGPQQIISNEALGVLRTIPYDLDNDGFIDVVSANKYSSDGKIIWYKNLDGNGSFSDEIIISDDIPALEVIELFDLNNDGDLDIIYKTNLDIIAWLENLDGQGNFGPEQIIANNNYPYTLNVADIDGDGDNDVFANLYHNSSFNRLVWYKNLDGQGNFSNEILIEIGEFYISTLLNFDLDNDGDLDLITSYESLAPSTLIWYENLDGLGEFSDAQEIYQFTYSSDWTSIYIMSNSDLNGDGKMDILLSTIHDDFPEYIYWLENIDLQGNFSEPQHIHTNETTLGSLRTYDLDNDNDQDILVSFYFGSNTKIAWFENTNGFGIFGPELLISSDVDDARDATAADLNDSNYLDVISASNSKVAWYENLIYLGVEDDIESNINLYPNPVNDILKIDNKNNSEISSIRIYDVLGRFILEETDQFDEFDVSHLKSGVLFLEIETEYGVVTRNIIKK